MAPATHTGSSDGAEDTEGALDGACDTDGAGDADDALDGARNTDGAGNAEDALDGARDTDGAEDTEGALDGACDIDGMLEIPKTHWTGLATQTSNTLHLQCICKRKTCESKYK